MSPGSKIEEGAPSPTPSHENERLLRGKCSFRGAMVVRDDGCGWNLECPLELGSTMVEAPVVLVDDERDVL